MKLCECGCGQPAPIAKKTIARLGHVKGSPIRFIQGHQGVLNRGTSRPSPSMETRQKRADSMRGKHAKESNPMWKGDAVGYWGVHAWIRTMRAKSGTCGNCGEAKRTEWANVSGRYERVVEDWIELCRRCHAWFDLPRRQPRSGSGAVGVKPTKQGRWIVRIHVDGRDRFFGTYGTVQEASQARHAAMLELRKEIIR